MVTATAASLMRAGLAFLIMLAAPAIAQQPPLAESDGRTIEYETVADAVKALSQKDGVLWHEENGWRIAVDKAKLTIWSFSPPEYQAYPAVVKRQAIARGAGSTIVMSVRCEADKDVCDQLVRTFAEMTGLPLPKKSAVCFPQQIR